VRQVPNYLIIGDGHMATHMCHYFRLASIPMKQWSRSKQTLSELYPLLKQATHLLLLINDGAIEPFIKEQLNEFMHLKIIHFSGALNTMHAYSAHPLCTFYSKQSYTLAEYQAIPFILDDHCVSFDNLMPSLKNPFHYINANDKSFYHAMCVLANNFTVLLWEKFFSEMRERFSIKETDLHPLLNKTLSNIANYPNIRKTGPLERNDKTTLNRNLNALENDSFQQIFNSFINTFTQGIAE
jgi:2-dehydropantoate 2-reductase